MYYFNKKLTIDDLIKKIQGLIKHYAKEKDNSSFQFFATSILRQNNDFKKEVESFITDCGFKFELINQEMELRYSFAGFKYFQSLVNNNNLKNIIYIDIGGGSIEAGFFKFLDFSKNTQDPTCSFFLQNGMKDFNESCTKNIEQLANNIKVFSDFAKLIFKNLKNERNVTFIFNGGNVKDITKSQKKDFNKISISALNKIYESIDFDLQNKKQIENLLCYSFIKSLLSLFKFSDFYINHYGAIYGYVYIN